MYITVIEWDGHQPPTQFYKRMSDLGLHVRGDKSTSPVDRRYSDKVPATIAQEGALFFQSKSLAEDVATYALRYGARSAHVGTVDFGMGDHYEVDQEGLERLARLERVFGRRGRPPSKTYDYVVTCFEEADSHSVNDVNRVANCPVCAATDVQVRRGLRHAFEPYRQGQHATGPYWIETRFAEGVFEVPAKGTEMILPREAIADQRERDLANMMKTDEIAMRLADVYGQRVLTLMDAMFVSRSHFDHDTRSKARLKAAMLAMKHPEVDASEVNLTEPDDHYDVFDLACHLEPQEVLDIFLRLKKGDTP